VRKRRLALLQVALEPAHSDPRQPPRFFPRDQDGELERFGQADSAELARQTLGDDEVPGLKSPSEDGARSSRRGRRYSSPGPERREGVYDLSDRLTERSGDGSATDTERRPHFH